MGGRGCTQCDTNDEGVADVERRCCGKRVAEFFGGPDEAECGWQEAWRHAEPECGYDKG